MKKYYASCKLLSQDNFEALVEFNHTNYKSSKMGPVGRDVITGTKIVSYIKKDHITRVPKTIKDAAEKGYIRKNALLFKDPFVFLEEISEEEVLEYLKSMSEDDISSYVKTIEDLKSAYNDSLVIVRLEKIDELISIIENKKETIKSQKEINNEKQRIRSLSKKH